ncbi:CBS domain-containing protein [Streptomyces sp. NPDC059991]|uniref:CBS domain-containing protein n=1 Tax=Streptomyces sp. NPDC059991 TaxID=3347028 RepID=UPI0036A5E144
MAGEGRVVGIVSEADLLLKEEFRGDFPDRLSQPRRLADLAKSQAVTAEALMSTPAVAVHPDATLAQAARSMAVRKVKRLPVIDRLGILQGVVSRSDLLKVFLRLDEEIAAEVPRTVIACLFPRQSVTATAQEGVVTFHGALHDRHLVPVAARLAHAVEGVVDVHMVLTARTSRHRPRHRGEVPRLPGPEPVRAGRAPPGQRRCAGRGPPDLEALAPQGVAVHTSRVIDMPPGEQLPRSC